MMGKDEWNLFHFNYEKFVNYHKGIAIHSYFGELFLDKKIKGFIYLTNKNIEYYKLIGTFQWEKIY
jgi:hypothetical protein